MAWLNSAIQMTPQLDSIHSSNSSLFLLDLFMDSHLFIN